MADEKKPGKISARIAALRERFPALDRVLRVQEHYSHIEGGVLASSATYFGFLSFFPLLALAFAVVGYISVAFPDARDHLITAIEELFPGIVSESGEQGTISLAQIENAKVTVGVIGFVGVLYSGLGWVSGLRTALADAFEVPRTKRRNFIVGKAIDVVALIVLGLILIVSVGVSSAVSAAAGQILDFLSLDDNPIGGPLIWVVGAVLGVAASTALFFCMFRILGNPQVSTRSLWGGALVGAIGFEVLKFLVVSVIGSLGGTAFAPLAIAVTLVVWINYFSKLVMYGASWAMTSPRVVAVRAAQEDQVTSSNAGPPEPEPAVLDDVASPAGGRFDAGSAVVGAAAGFVAARVLGRRRG